MIDVPIADASAAVASPTMRSIRDAVDAQLSPTVAARVSSHLVGRSEVLARLRADVARVSGSQATVLVTGPTGSGKENVARAIHEASPRSGGAFVAVNCGAIPGELTEAELFGVEAGAFTGATRSRKGRLEAASGGTLFLDEVGDLPPALQVKLLRVLETREVERLGGGRSIAVDIRIIAATNVDLEEAVAAGRFRADLYWRLAVVWLDLPPLNQHIEDIPELIAHFVSSANASLYLTEDARNVLQAHDWPGNVREVRNFVDRALAMGYEKLGEQDAYRLLHPRRRPVGQWLGQVPCAVGRPPRDSGLMKNATPLEPVQLKELLAEAEAALIMQALEASGGTIAASARMLGLKRTTLIEKMRRIGLNQHLKID